MALVFRDLSPPLPPMFVQPVDSLCSKSRGLAVSSSFCEGPLLFAAAVAFHLVTIPFYTPAFSLSFHF